VVITVFTQLPKNSALATLASSTLEESALHVIHEQYTMAQIVFANLDTSEQEIFVTNVMPHALFV
jgi:hypothetical protein